MIRVLIFILIVIFPLIGFSQTEVDAKQSQLHLGVCVGINITKFHNDSIVLSNGFKPYIGIYAKYNIINKLYLKTSVSYSVKGSRSLKPYVKIKNQYMDMNFIPQYQISGDFYINAGVSYSYILNSQYVVRNGDNIFGLEYQDIEGYDSEFNLIAGLEFILYDNISFEINYIIPLKENNTANFQLGINVSFNKNTDTPKL